MCVGVDVQCVCVREPGDEASWCGCGTDAVCVCVRDSLGVRLVCGFGCGTDAVCVCVCVCV